MKYYTSCSIASIAVAAAVAAAVALCTWWHLLTCQIEVDCTPGGSHGGAQIAANRLNGLVLRLADVGHVITNLGL